MSNQDLINNWEPKKDGLKIAKILQETFDFLGKEDLYITMNDPEVSFIVSSFTTALQERLEAKLNKSMKLSIERFSVGTCGVNSKVLVTLQLRRVSK
jgi:hypothetical protein